VVPLGEELTMKIDDKLWMFAYKNVSESAKLLAEKADIWMIKHEGSNFKGKPGQFILNWGAGTGVYTAATGGAVLLNPPQLIDIAVSKLEWFEQMHRKGGPRVPEWTTSIRTARGWIEDGETVVCRTQLEGCKGAGIVVAKKDVDIVRSPLYTIKVDNAKEYRVYMFNDEVLDFRIKKGKPTNGMMIGDDIEFVMTDELPPDDVILQARKAARCLKLTTQGVDVVWDGEKAYVLETNTAPYLGIQTAKKYAARLTKMVAEAA
jgi:glutathione synthase/RimK-type ligase-like ATP-grasp enzyme